MQGHVRSAFVSSLRLRNKCEANWPIKIIPSLSNRTGKKELGIHHSLYATLFNGPTYRRWWNDLMEFINFELCYTTFCQLQRLPHVTLGKMTAIDVLIETNGFRRVLQKLGNCIFNSIQCNSSIGPLFKRQIFRGFQQFLRVLQLTCIRCKFFRWFPFLSTQPTSSFLQRFCWATRFFFVKIL